MIYCFYTKKKGESGMNGLKNALTAKNMMAGWLYFYIHFATEVTCFFFLSRQYGDSVMLWLFPFVYDALAFVPQSPIGYLCDKFKKINGGIVGIVLMAFAGLMFEYLPVSPYIPLVILCIGNAFTHVGGAETTLRVSDGRLAHSAVFVSGGSFGVVTGRLLSSSDVSGLIIVLFILTAIPFALLADTYLRDTEKQNINPCEKFNYANPKLSAAAVIILATLVVAVRGYMGYGIPTAWKKTLLQTVCLYVTMGIGKAAGGIFADAFGVRKTAVFSVSAALPFLLAGNNHMGISLVGVMIFSMTMSITLALLVSVLKKTPGFAFGFTTLGLFLGTAPIFFFRFTSVRANCIVISALSVLCLAALMIIGRKDEKINE